MSEATEHASLTVDGRLWEVLRVDGREALSTLFRFEVLARSAAHDPTLPLAGAAAVLTLDDGRSGTRTITGVVASARRDDEAMSLVLRPKAHALTLGRNARTFQEVDIRAIVGAVLAGATPAVPARWELASTYRVRAYTAQYRESDHDFVSRLIEDEGIFYYVDPDGSIVLSDDSTRAEDLGPIAFQSVAGLESDREVIEELGGAAAYRPARFSVASFDPARPALPLRGSEGSGRIESYDAPGAGPDSPDACAARAKLLAQAARAAGSGVSGKTSSVRLAPGLAFSVQGHPIGRYDARWLVTEVETHVVQRQRAGAEGAPRAYTCRFRAIAAGVPFRPERRAPAAKMVGLGGGVVIGPGGEEIYPDATGRVRAQLHWDRGGARDATSGTWMRAAQRGTAGSMLLPRIGWNVLTFNEEGSVDAPSVLSRIHDGDHRPSYALPANKTRTVFRTATSPGGGSHNEIRLEDKQGSEEMFLNASRDMTVLVNNIKSDGVGRNQARTVAVDSSLTVGDTLSQTITGNQTVAVGASETLTVTAARTKEVRGDEAVTIGGSLSLTCPEHSNQVEGTRSVSVGAAIIDVSLGTISASAHKRTSLLAGGAVVRLSLGSITEGAGKVAVATVGGAKVEIANKDRVLDFKHRLFETVGGAMILDTEDTFTDSSDKNATWKAGASLRGEGPAVSMEATEKITIVCGGSSITLTAEGVEVSATEYDLGGAKKLVTMAKKVEHNA